MEFVGTNGVAAPRLKDAVIGLTEDGKKDETEISDVYFECIMMMRHLY
jgi:serine/threonine-protein kinase RIO1